MMMEIYLSTVLNDMAEV